MVVGFLFGGLFVGSSIMLLGVIIFWMVLIVVLFLMRNICENVFCLLVSYLWSVCVLSRFVFLMFVLFDIRLFFVYLLEG